MGRGVIAGMIWKRSCINLFIIYFRQIVFTVKVFLNIRLSEALIRRTNNEVVKRKSTTRQTMIDKILHKTKLEIQKTGSGNQELTTWHTTLGTQYTGRRQTKQKHNTGDYKFMSNTDPTQNMEWTQMLTNDKQFLLLIRHPPCYSYSQD